MRILHLCLSCFYIDDALYQENLLVREHAALGHTVKVIASTEVMSKSGQITYTSPSEYLGSDGVAVTRLPYRNFLPHFVMKKLRMHPKVYAEIEKFAPNVIIFHGACGWEIQAAAKYVRQNPHVHLYIDSHEDANNSARSFVSREFLHKRYYGPLLRRSLPIDGRIFCISLETIDFVNNVYKIPRENLEFFPLGGHPLSDEKYNKIRNQKRSALGVDDGSVMFFQSGKFDKLKRLLPSLKAFSRNKDPDFKLFLSGVIANDDNFNEIQSLIRSDPRIKFLGWSDGSEMVELLAAADVYLQPGSQSVTMQNSMCQRCAIIIDDVKSHIPYIKGNGFLTKAGDDLDEIFNELSLRKEEISEMGNRSHEIAQEMLDYAKLAKRMLPV